ncbi:POU class 2 homeobox associating-factor 2 [Neoarius graeffei]|uniref:POU class 2 homeobox associating-factor 2 n=1 Tax=Neoarius graeffei TaxID=443677 RepID=UPI00298BE718|nr:POU class 2 homeobox associating-factor 2 [Neoarius graeffei]
MEAEYSKRVYQGVRVKHTVKDLLAEKRSRQTSGPRFAGVSAQSPLIQMAGSHTLPGYYGMRRPFFPDAEFCSSSKQFSTDIYSSALTGKSFSCDITPMSTYSSLIDSCYPESFSDYRSVAHSGGGSSVFSSTALATRLPHFPGDTSHFMLRDSWEQAGMEPAEALCGNSLVPAPVELSSPSQYRSSSRSSSMGSSQFYSLHTLDDVPYPSSFQLPSNFPCPTYSEHVAKLPALSTEDTETVPSALNDMLPWVKEDATGAWSHCEIRRTF